MTDLNILVPLDNSANSQRTIQTLLAMKGKITCPLTLLHVLDPEKISYRGVPRMHSAMIEERARKAAEEFIAGQQALLAKAGVQATTLLKEGPARRTICELADSGEFDLLIIGRHTEGELRNLLFGQVSNYVIHKVKCPVMIV